MKMAANMSIFRIPTSLIFLLSCLTFTHSSGVPVLFWSSSRSMAELPEVYMGHVLNNEEFDSKYLKPTIESRKETIIVFTQNKMSMEDFIHYGDVYNAEASGGVFKNVKNLVEENFSLQLPEVIHPELSLEHLMTKFQSSLSHITNIEDLRKLDLLATRLVIFTLPDIMVGKEEESFRRNDQIIADACSELTKHGVNYIAIFTSFFSPKEVEDDYQLKFQGRHLLAKASENTNKSIFVNESSCLLMYSRAINLLVSNKTKTGDVLKITFRDPINTEVNCPLSNDTNITLSMSFNPPRNSSNLTLFTLDLTFQRDAKVPLWSISDARVVYSGQLPGETVHQIKQIVPLNVGLSYLRTSWIWCPIGMSYHCTDPKPMSLNFGNDSSIEEYEFKVTFDKLQVEAFGVNVTKFSGSYDCVGFFTGTIWTGIVSVAILLIILHIGLSMISNIRVMQNFDDPKGKPLIIAAEK